MNKDIIQEMIKKFTDRANAPASLLTEVEELRKEKASIKQIIIEDVPDRFQERLKGYSEGE